MEIKMEMQREEEDLNFGDVLVSKEGDFFMLIKNEHEKYGNDVSLLNLRTSNIDNSYRGLKYIKEYIKTNKLSARHRVIEIVQIIKSTDLMLTKKQ